MAITKLKKVRNIVDGWSNLLTGLGTSKDKRMYAQASWSRMDQSTAETLYASDDMAAKVADFLPDEATRQGITFKNINEDLRKKLSDAMEAFQVLEKLNEADKWARVYGGAGSFLVVDDGKDLSEPMVLDEVRGLKNIINFSRWELSPAEIDQDINSPNFGLPLTYNVSSQAQSNESLAIVHHTRIMRFDGVKLPRRLEIRNNYWGDSIFTRLENALRNFNTVHDTAASALQDFNTDIFRMKNLAELIASGQEAQIKQRIELANMSKSVLKAIVLDLEEDYETKSRSLTGVDTLLTKADQRLTASASMPHTLLLGESPSGLGASGKSEERAWYDFVKRHQELRYKRKLNIIIPLVAKTIDLKLPDGWSYEFNSLWQMTDKETVEMRTMQSQMDKVYIEMGVLDPAEVTASRFGGETYSIETTLDMNTREQIQKTTPTEPVNE